MPRGDGTGPDGRGSRTGRQAGFCAGYNVPGFMNPVGGRLGLARGFRGGFGRGFGFRSRYTVDSPEPAELTKTEQIKILENELIDIGTEKKEIEKAIKELRSSAK